MPAVLSIELRRRQAVMLLAYPSLPCCRPQSSGAGPGPLQLGAQPFMNSLTGPSGGAQPSSTADQGSLWQTQQPAPANLTVRTRCANLSNQRFLDEGAAS